MYIKYIKSPSLGRWVSNQRTPYRLMKEGESSNMKVDKIQALEAMGFTWHIDVWAERYEELRNFKLEKGHCDVPQGYSINSSLGTWVSTQRRQYRLMKEGKPSTMKVDKIKALEALGFTWQRYAKCSDA